MCSEQGQVFVNNVVERNVDAVVPSAAVVGYYRTPWVEPECPLTYDVIYEDEHMLCVDKPSGLPTLPSELYYEHTLLRLLERSALKQGQPVPIPVHRLGVGTSGLVVAGKSSDTRRLLTMAFEGRSVHKTYRALVQGIVQLDHVEITCPIGLRPYGSRCVEDLCVLRQRKCCLRLGGVDRMQDWQHFRCVGERQAREIDSNCYSEEC
jgi:23S rRNA pseudouridine1911/1915/1917 synthase